MGQNHRQQLILSRRTAGAVLAALAALGVQEVLLQEGQCEVLVVALAIQRS